LPWPGRRGVHHRRRPTQGTRRPAELGELNTRRSWPRWTGRSRSAGGGPPTSGPSWAAAPVSPTGLILATRWCSSFPRCRSGRWPTARSGGRHDLTAQAALPLAPDLAAGLRRLRLAGMRQFAPDMLITARTQRWAPDEILRTLVEAEIAAREASNARARIKVAALPVTKSLDELDRTVCSVPGPTLH
jgi:hypothetical protein